MARPLAFRWEIAVRDFAPPDWTPAKKAVLYTLRTWMNNKTGLATVPQDMVARGAGVARSTAAGFLAEADEEGWLIRTPWQGRGQSRRRTQYRAVIPPQVAKRMREGCSLSGQGQEQDGPDHGGTLSGSAAGVVPSQDTNSLGTLTNTGRENRSVLSQHTTASSEKLERRSLSEVGTEGSRGSPEETVHSGAQAEARHLFGQLTDRDKDWLSEQMPFSFPPERISPAFLQNLPREVYKRLEKRITSRGGGKAA